MAEKTRQATVISESAFEELQIDAGVILKEFSPSTKTVDKANIVCATTGGITVNCVPTYSDFGEDIDNCPNNMMEYKHLDGWECSMNFVSLGMSEESIKMALGAHTTGENSAILPRRSLEQSDFADIWWVGDLNDGGLAAVCLKNALSTGGFSLKTEKNGKGQITIELTGHVSVDAQEKMPMEFYILPASA